MFIFNNVESRDYNIKVLKDNHLEGLERKVEIIPIPGRKGDLVVLDSGEENKELLLECIGHTKGNCTQKELLEIIYEWLTTDDYKEIKFTDGIIKMAFFLGLEGTEKLGNSRIRFTLKFTCYNGGKNDTKNL